MATVDPIFAQWLQADGRWQVATDDARVAQWADRAITVERLTSLVSENAASAEAARRMTFFGVPLAADRHSLRGQWAGYLGQVIRLTIDRLGYETGADVFVIAVDDNIASGTSSVLVLKRLA